MVSSFQKKPGPAAFGRPKLFFHGLFEKYIWIRGYVKYFRSFLEKEGKKKRR